MSGQPALRPVMELVRLAAQYLQGRGSSSPRLDAELLLGHVLGLDRLQLYVQFDRPVVPAEVDRFRELIRRRGAGEPVAYLLGEREFRSLPFQVNPAVLIPRPETELLVEAALEAIRGAGTPVQRVVDVGTGSGAIAVSLALELEGAAVAATDVSAAALEVARANARRHGVESRIRWFEGDLLEPVAAAGFTPLQAVVSNPPYVATGDWQRLEPTVRDYEPRLALDGGPDGLALIRRLVAQSARLLEPGGLLALEVGAGQRPAVTALLEKAGFTGLSWRMDGLQHPRVVVARLGERGRARAGSGTEGQRAGGDGDGA